MSNAKSALRFAYRAIYLTHDDTPEDRKVWSNATQREQLGAELEVRAESEAVWSRLTKREALGHG